MYNAAIVDLKTEYDKIKGTISDYERGDHVEVDQLKAKLLQQLNKTKEQKTTIDHLMKVQKRQQHALSNSHSGEFRVENATSESYIKSLEQMLKD